MDEQKSQANLLYSAPEQNPKPDKKYNSAFKQNRSGILAGKPPGPKEIVEAVEMNRAMALMALDEDIKKIKKEKAIKEACKKGCDACCYTLVPITFGEDAVALAESIRNGSFNAAFSAAGILDSAYRDAGIYELWEKGRLTEAANKAYELKMSCPFLNHEDSTCMIYKKRPIVCFSRLAPKITKGHGKGTAGRPACKENLRESKGLFKHCIPTRSITGVSDLEIREEKTRAAFRPLPMLVYRTAMKIAQLSDSEKLSALGDEEQATQKPEDTSGAPTVAVDGENSPAEDQV